MAPWRGIAGPLHGRYLKGGMSVAWKQQSSRAPPPPSTHIFLSNNLHLLQDMLVYLRVQPSSGTGIVIGDVRGAAACRARKCDRLPHGQANRKIPQVSTPRAPEATAALQKCRWHLRFQSEDSNRPASSANLHTEHLRETANQQNPKFLSGSG